jgi:pimeloyl-ACP methyl ester carboxylesterase
VLIMAGQHDVIREPHTREIAKRIPGSTLVIFKKGTHYEPQEDPVRFNKTVLDFFARPPL